MNNQPRLSVVVTARNDNHGGELLKRMQLFLDGLFTQSEQFRVSTELIIVEWNPPAGEPQLADVLQWPHEHSHCQTRIITVPKSIHDQYDYAERLPLFQMIAKNVGIRRSSGEFILVTNIDILLSDELFAFIASDNIKHGHIYRVDRLDVDQNIASTLSHEERLEYCRSNILRINDRLKSLFIETGEKHPIYPEDTDKYYTSRFGTISALHTNACGDFQMMGRQHWFDLCGYAELEYYSLHIDSVMEINAHYGGATEICLAPPMCCYHIEHESGWKPEASGFEKFKQKFSAIKRMSYDELFYINRKATRQKKAVQFNNQHWGLDGINLPETLIGETTVSTPGDSTNTRPVIKGLSRWSVYSHLLGFYPFLVPVIFLKYWRIFYIFARIHVTKFMAKPDYGIAIFGAGIYGIRLNEELKKRKVSIRCFIDNDESLHNTEIDGVPVISPARNNSQFEELDTIFIGSLSFMDDMKTQLKEIGFRGQII